MRKALLGTSAIALASAFAGQAQAAEWDVDVGGFMEAWVGYGSTDVDNPATVGGIPIADDRDGVDAKSDGEIIFAPSITLDNGLKIGANVQLEVRCSSAGAGGTGDCIDEQYVYVQGSFGEVLIGDENSAGYKMTYAAPDVSFLGVNSGSTTIFVAWSGAVQGVAVGADVFRATLGSTFIENERNNDAGRITYFTPRFAGFQLGVSYARDATQNTLGMIGTSAAAASDIVDIGANYVNSFGDFDIAASGRYGFATDNRTPVLGTDIGNDPEIFGFGLNLGYAGFTIGGSWAEQNGSGDEDGNAYDVGVSYRTGPWGFSFTYFHGENVDDELTAGDSGVGIGGSPITGIDEEVDQFLLAIDYDLAKGVDLNLLGGYIDFDEETGDGAAANGGNDVEGFFIATGMRLRF